jgi:hypothetical protein
MKRSFGSWAALVLLASLSGCSACQSPFDYCAPVTAANGCQTCDFGARRGSIFAPVDGIPATTAVASTPEPSRPPAAPRYESPSEETPGPTPDPLTTERDAGVRNMR